MKTSEQIREGQINHHIDALRRLTRDSQEDYTLQRLGSQMINGPSKYNEPVGTGDGYARYYRVTVIPPLQAEVRFLEGQIDAMEEFEQELTTIRELLTQHVGEVDFDDLVGTLKTHLDHCVEEPSLEQAMAVFCETCDKCGPPYQDSFPVCLDDDDPSPSGNGPVCEVCKEEFFRLYNGGEPRPKHQCYIQFCCLRALVGEVTPYASEMIGLKPDVVEGVYEILFNHIEEAWDPVDLAAENVFSTGRHPVDEIFDEAEAELAAQSHIDGSWLPGCA